MNVDQVYIVDELKEKIQLLKQRMEEHKNNYSRLASEYRELSDRISEQEKNIKQLKNENKTLKLAKAFVSDSEASKDARLQINRIVREIDKCIALLNR
jgi:predicted  nucleic acid-binding Zn-ribbon protein